MADTSKQLSLKINPSDAKKGAKEIREALEAVSKEASKLQKDLGGIAELMQKSTSKPKSDAAKAIKDVNTAVSNLERTYNTLFETNKDINKAWLQANTILKDQIKSTEQFTLAKAQNNKEYLEEYKLRKSAILDIQKEKNAIDEELKSQKGMTAAKRESLTATQRQTKALEDAQERNSENNESIRKAIALENQKRTSEAQSLKYAQLLTDAGRKRWEQLEAQRVAVKAYQSAFTRAKEEELGLTNKVSIAQKIENELKTKQARSEALLAAAKDGTLEATLRLQKAEKEAVEAVKSSVSAMSQAEKEAKAYDTALEKLSKTKLAEEARTKALATGLGRESVQVQENRRQKEELARSIERLNLMRTEEGKKLIQTRVQAEQLAKKYREEITGAQKTLRTSTDGLSSSFSALTTAMSGVAVYFSVGGIVRTADAYTNLSNRLKAVSDSTVNVTDETRKMLAMSIENRSTLDATMDVYSKLIRANKALGMSQEDVVQITDTVSKAVAMSGASAAGAEGAMMQFGQAMSNNFTAAGQELNSILEQTPALAEAMANGLRKITGDSTITAASLKKMGEQGELSSELIASALKAASEDVAESFKNTDATINSAMKNLKDSFTLAIGGLDDLYEVSESVTEAFKEINQELPDLQANIAGVATSLATFIGAAGLGGMITLLSPAGRMILLVSGAVSTLAGAIAAASVKQKAYIKNIEDIEAANIAAAESTDKWVDSIEALNVAQLAGKNETIVGDLDKVNADLEVAREKLVAVQEAGIVAGSDNSLVQRAEAYAEAVRLAQREVDGLTESRARLEGQYIETLLPDQTNYLNSFEDGVSALDIALKGIKTPMDAVNKAQKEWETTSKDLDKQLQAVISSSALLEDQEAAQLVISEKTNEVNTAKAALWKKLQDALEAYQKKANELSDEEKRRVEIDKTTTVLYNEVEALKEGAKYYERFLKFREAASALGYEDLSLVPEDELKDLETIAKLQELIKKNLEQNAFDKSLKTTTTEINAQVKALKSGEDAYDDYLYRVQAIQSLGGIIPEGEEEAVGKLAGKLKEAAEASKAYQESLQREDNLQRFNEEYEALKQGEKEYQELLLKRKAMQILATDDYENNKDAVDDLMSKLKEMDSFKVDPFSEMTGSLKSGISSFQELAEITGVGGKEMEVAMAAVNAAQATYAVLNQASGNPYTAFARMAAMASSVAQLGQSVGNLSGGDPTEERQASQGTGSVLGDLDAKSESIANSIEYSADALEDLVGINTGILDAMQTLANAIEGATNLIARDVDYDGIATGLGASTGMKLSGDLGAGAGKLFDSLFFGLTDGLFKSLGGALGSILGGAFGSSKVTDEGVRILGGTLTEMLEQSSTQAYQDIKKSKAWGLSTSTSTSYRDVSEAVEQQFDLTFLSIFDAVENAATGLGYATEGIQDKLDAFVVETQKISLEGLSPSEVSEQLNAVFSKVFDELAANVIPLTTEMQKAGEGAGKTLSRLATNFAVVGEVVDQLRLDALTGSTDDIIRLSTAFAEMAGGASELASQMTDFVGTFATEERQLEILQGNLVDALGEQDRAILESRDGVYSYIDAIEGSSESELSRIANIVSLTDSLDEYFNLVDAVKDSQEEANEYVSEAISLQDQLNQINNSISSAMQVRIQREEELAQATSNTAKMYLKAIYLAEDLAAASDLADSLDIYSGAITTTVATLRTANNALEVLGMQGKTYINALKDLETLDNQDLVFLADDLGISLSKLGEYIENLKSASDVVTGDGDQGVVDNARNRVNTLQNSIQDISDDLFGGVIPHVSEVIEEVFNRTVAQSSDGGEQALLEALSPYQDRINALETTAGKSITDISNLKETYISAMETAFGETVDASVLTSEKLKELNNYSNQVRGGNLLISEVEAWSDGLEAGTIAIDSLKEFMSKDEGAKLFEDFQEIQRIINDFTPATDTTIPKLEELKNALINLPDAQEALDSAISSLADTTEGATDSINDLSEALSKRADLENTLLQLQGDTQELRNRELESLKEIYGWQSQRLVSLQEEVWLVQDFQSTVGSVRDALDLDTISLEEALSSLSAFGNDADSILNTFAELSQSDLKEYFETTGITVGSLSSNLDVLVDSLDNVDDSISDLLTQAKEAADSAFSDLSNSIEAEKDLLKDSYESQSESISNSIDTVSDSVSNLGSVSNKLKDALRNITTESKSLTLSTLRGGQEALRGMISAGGVDDEDLLSNVISTLSTDNRSVFGTYKDYVKSQSSSLSLINELGSITEDQLTTEEKTLNNLKEQLETLEKTYNLSVEDLDRTLDSYQQQLNALNGINNSVLSVVQAIANMESSLTSLSNASGGSSGSFNKADYGWTQDTELQAIKNMGVEWAQVYQGGSTSQILKDALTAKAIETGFVDGSHANGADYIPFDNYKANLHKGEMVLTAPVANEIREMASRRPSDVNLTDERVIQLLSTLVNRVDSFSYNTNKKLIKLEKMEQVIAKWDNTGRPQTRNY